MDVREIATTEFPSIDVDTRVSELVGAFDDPTVKAVVVTDNGSYAGLVTQRQLDSAHQDPNTKAGSILWHVARLDIDDDVRTAARLMLGSDSLVLPVYRDDEFYGVATADDLLDAVEPYLHVLSVDDVWTPEIVTVDPASTLGNVLHQFREHRITHLPVVDGNRAIGVVSLSDVIGFAAREAHRSQGGNPPEAVQGGRSHGGFGAREGELHRLLDLPVRDVMSEPVVTVRPDTRLDDAVRTMFDREVSSLVVTVDDAPAGIATKNDVLESLTWTGETRLQVKFVGIELLDDISRDEVVDMIERIAQRYGEMRILEASVYLHEHDEKLRGTPLVLARIRLFTDRGQFVGTGEGYGASHALHLARNVLERDVLEGKQYGQTKKHPTEEELSKFYGWWLTGSARPR